MTRAAEIGPGLHQDMSSHSVSNVLDVSAEGFNCNQSTDLAKTKLKNQKIEKYFQVNHQRIKTHFGS